MPLTDLDMSGVEVEAAVAGVLLEMVASGGIPFCAETSFFLYTFQE